MSKIGYPLRKIEEFAFNSSSLSNLNMQETNFHFALGNFIPTSILSLSPNLTFLYLDQSFLPKTKIWIQQMFSSLTKLKVISLFSGNLAFLPQTSFQT